MRKLCRDRMADVMEPRLPRQTSGCHQLLYSLTETLRVKPPTIAAMADCIRVLPSFTDREALLDVALRIEPRGCSPLQQSLSPLSFENHGQAEWLI
jgi:hypothetical protein